jgi:hypothetical protein
VADGMPIIMKVAIAGFLTIECVSRYRLLTGKGKHYATQKQIKGSDSAVDD